MDDSAIIDLYFARSEKAIQETGVKYGNYLHTIAENILHTQEDSEEAVNDTYLAAWNAMPPTRPRVLRHFLSRIVRNLSFKRYSYLTADKPPPERSCSYRSWRNASPMGGRTWGSKWKSGPSR